MMLKMFTLASLVALLGVLLIQLNSPFAYGAAALAASGGVAFALRKAKRAVGSDGFAGDLPPHVRRSLEGRKK
jgi:hypothetical protein